MNFEYDSWNRIQEITYPDSEVVRYTYNLGGLLAGVSSDKHGETATYVHNILYDKFEMKSAVRFGNGTKSSFRYDSLRRLKNLSTIGPDGMLQDIIYTYDSVGNITRMANNAGVLANGLGGTYWGDYMYDELYRLVRSEGEWHGAVPQIHYITKTGYTGNGRVKEKSVAANTWIGDHPENVNYFNGYFYEDSDQPNTLTRVVGQNGMAQYFGWDAKGNMTSHTTLLPEEPSERSLCWDEQNRLQGVKDNKHLSFYQYDAGGERTYKLAGDFIRQNQNGIWRHYYSMTRPTLYASPYMVVTLQGYTKHYYAEAERICSKIGGGGLHRLDTPVVAMEQAELKSVQNTEHMNNLFVNCLNVPDVQLYPNLLHLEYWQYASQEERCCYYYHPDHLGSSSWITDTGGHAIQHLHYLPWGEDFVDQRSTTWNAMYTFSAKEKDAETGYSYFGSRYYNSDLSIWLSVDPMASKYPSLSPYAYCANNPVKLVDPNGEEVYIIGDNDNKNTIINSLNGHFANITVDYDKTTGKLNIVEGSARTEDEIAFAEAIANTKIEVNLKLVNDKKTGYKTPTGDDLEIEGAGAFLGNTISYKNGNQTKENIAKVQTLQCLSVGEMERLYSEKDWGKLINHEITESFQGGLISSDNNVPGRDENGVINSDIYKKAHAAATPQLFTIGASWFHH